MGERSELTMAGQAVLTITAPAGAPNEESLVPVALNLGWRIAQFYDAPISGETEAVSHAGEHLPGISGFGRATRSVILLGQVAAALKSLQGVLQFSESDVNLDSIQNLVHDPEARTQVLRLHMQITDRLTTNAARLGTAYELGRALADTCNLTGGQVGDDLVRMFNQYRLENLYDWLGQLDELFPERAARAVARSLHLWESWLSKQAASIPHEVAYAAGRVLTRQGELWRRVLTAEQDPLRLLGPQDYVNAGIGFLVRIRRMITQFAIQWAAVILLLLVGLGVAIWAAVTYASTDAGKLAAVLASLIGALGLSWKGIGGTLGKALGVVERPLWDAEVDTVLAQAITKLPHTKNPSAGIVPPAPHG